MKKERDTSRLGQESIFVCLLLAVCVADYRFAS